MISRKTLIRSAVLGILALVAAAIFWFVPVHDWLRSVLAWIDSTGPAGPVILGAMYIPVSILFVPAWPLTLGAGFMFGVLRGTVATSIGSVCGAAAAFLAGRTVGRRFIEHRIANNPKFEAIDRAVAEQGFKIVLLTRLSPVLPFNLLNYMFGLTKVSFRSYLLASWIGMLPGTVMYVYLGSAAQSLAKLGSDKAERSPAEKTLFGVGLAATILVAILIARIAKKALDRSIGP